LVSGYTKLTRNNDGSWTGLCPLHNEKTPSFRINTQKNVFHCFGCGKGGSPITFLMAANQLNFVDALKDLAERAGIELPSFSREEESQKANRAGILEVHRLAQDYFYANLRAKSGVAAYDYLRERGMSRQVLEDFGFGLAPDGWRGLLDHLKAKGFSESLLLEAGLIKRKENTDKYYDVFRNRVMIPVMDAGKKVVAFAGRVYGEGADPSAPKYINSPKTVVYEKGRLLYGLSQARVHIRSGEMAFIVEGYFDLIALVSAGVKPVVASMGTALTQPQVDLLRGLAKGVHLVFDGDSAGEKASKRALPLLYNAGLDGRVIRLPQAHDPDSFVRQFGPDAFYDLADKAMDIADFLFGSAMAMRSTTLSGQSRVISDVQEILSQIPDAAKGQHLRNQLADKLKISAELLTLSPIEANRSMFEGAERTNKNRLQEMDYNNLAAWFLQQVVTYPECRDFLTDDLLEFWPQDRTRAVLEGFLDQKKERGDIFPEEIRLEEDPAMSEVVSKALTDKRKYNSQDSRSMAKDLIKKISSLTAQKVNEDYTKAIKEAEANGDTETVLKLLAAKMG
jgi:DNA primase